jgi:hypothetical protein
MPFAKIACAGLLSGVASVTLACELPPVVIIPAKENVNGKEAELRAATSDYFQAMRDYTQCVQAELAAAGGDSAPPLTRSLLVQRNNHAVAEAQAVLKVFTANVGAIEQSGPPVSGGGAQR